MTGPRLRQGRRPRACYHEAGHCLARWYFGHNADRAIVLTLEEVRAGAWPVNRKGIVSKDCEGVVEGYNIGPNSFFPTLPSNISPEDRAQMELGQVMGTDVALVEGAIGIEAEARYTKRSGMLYALLGGRGDMNQAAELAERRFPDPAERRAARLRTERWARALVRSEPGWQAITSIAVSLHQKGVVEWDEIGDLCSAAYERLPAHLGEWMAAWPPTEKMLHAGSFPAAQSRSALTIGNPA